MSSDRPACVNSSVVSSPHEEKREQQDGSFGSLEERIHHADELQKHSMSPFDISILRKSDVSKHFDTGKRGQNVFDVAIYGKFDIASSTNPNIRYRMVGKTRSIFRSI